MKFDTRLHQVDVYTGCFRNATDRGGVVVPRPDGLRNRLEDLFLSVAENLKAKELASRKLHSCPGSSALLAPSLDASSSSSGIITLLIYVTCLTLVSLTSYWCVINRWPESCFDEHRLLD